jgi:formylglycine-generating enzyme required for sulfatase activity
MNNFQMIYVEEGTFMIGSNDGYDNQKPIHEVTLSRFYIGQFTVTQKEWEAVMGSNPSEDQGDNLPITHVSWNDVQEFIAKLNLQTDMQYRLPTEAEWEYAARGGNQSNGFEYAGSNNVDEVAWHRGNCNDTLFPIGQKKPNELGLYDMSGNVFEWCEDWYGDYPSTPQMNPKGPDTGKWRILRGGSWDDHSQYCRINYRSNLDPNARYNFIGFRLAHDFETF